MDYMTESIYKKLLVWIDEDDLIRFYKTKTWRKVREIVLRSNGWRCAKCGKKATMVHHKLAVKLYPRLALKLSNLEPECNSCHNLEHPEKLEKFNQRKFMNEERW